MGVPRAGSFFEAAFVEARQIGGVCVAVIDERVLSDHQAAAAKHRLSQLAAAHRGRLAVSLSKADGSSMGLFAALLQVQDRCVRLNGRMVLFSLAAGTAESLVRFDLLEKFTIADDLEEAMDLLHRPPVTSGTPGRPSRLGQWLGMGRAAA